MKEKVKYYPRLSGQHFYFDHVHIRFDQQVPLHQQETWELSYIITGRGARIIGDTVENFSSGEVILIPPNIPHCWSFDENVHDEQGKIENICIFIEDSFWSACKVFFPELSQTVSDIQLNENAVSFTGICLDDIKKIMVDMVHQDPIGRLSSFIKLLKPLAQSRQMQVVGNPIIVNSSKKKLQEIQLYVLCNYHKLITITDVAQSVGMQGSSFCTFFKKMTGRTFFTHLLEFRLESSCQMLIKTNLTIAEICIASGFNDVPYYNRVFKKMKNMTPSNYRTLMGVF